MSNGYYGPYQSRLLNFISKQSRQVADNCDRTWRQIKQATLSTTQILLYPAYLLVQSSRMLSRQLRESSQTIDLPELQEFAGDNPDLSENWYGPENSEESSIAQILYLAENLLNSSQTATTAASFPQLIQENTAATSKAAINLSLQTAKDRTTSARKYPLAKTKLTSPPKVQGIASFIPARTLVLVGGENRILDMLTPQQQEFLESRITWEVANCGQERREITQKELKFNLGLASAAKKAQLPPMRRFWELMAWLQTSPVALKRNQFGESILAVKSAIDRNAILLEKATTPIAIANIPQQSIAASKATDSPTPELANNFNSKFDRSGNPISFVTLLDRAAVNLEEFTLPPSPKTAATNPEVTNNTSNTENNLGLSGREILEKYAQNIEKMIWSSVDNLLGKETAASDNTEKSVSIQYYLKQRQREKAEKSPEVDRPWLKWEDLFGEAAPQQSIAASSAAEATAQSDISQNIPKVKEEIGESAESRSTAIPTSPYPEAIHRLVAQLKQSLLAAKVPNNQPAATSNLAVTPENRAPLATASTPGCAQETQVSKHTNSNTTPTGKSPAAISQPTSRYSPVTTTAQAKNQSVAAQPEDEYLETKAESMGYIKHPLEQVLEWLDLVMLRIEKIAEQIWNWAKINLPKILNTKDKID